MPFLETANIRMLATEYGLEVNSTRVALRIRASLGRKSDTSLEVAVSMSFRPSVSETVLPIISSTCSLNVCIFF